MLQIIEMTDRQCVEFLQWALPRLDLRWRGFRKVRRQVHKRIVRRMGELRLAHIAEYRRYLETHPDEWPVLDSFLRISISRFYRDRDVFDHLRDQVLPDLARRACDRCEHMRAWSAGCASGEEPYTLSILWARHVQPVLFPEMCLDVLATDADPHMLQRAREASYPASSLKDVPADWRETAFVPRGDQYVLRPEFQAHVEFHQQDIRAEIAEGPFDLILCRNLICTYFAEPLQRQVLEQMAGRLVPGGVLIVGKHEAPPEGTRGLKPSVPGLGCYRAS